MLREIDVARERADRHARWEIEGALQRVRRLATIRSWRCATILLPVRTQQSPWVKRLENDGYITGRVTLLDREKLGLGALVGRLANAPFSRRDARL